MAFTTSINIERDFGSEPDYIITANARQTAGRIVSQYNSGMHSFCLIGSYGSGKSSFIIALENTLLGKNATREGLISDVHVFNGFSKFEFLNIVGDYSSLSSILAMRLESGDDDLITSLDGYYQSVQQRNAFLVIVIDEFGKILEHAAKNNPEKEMYFLQKFCEYINAPSRNTLFICTLHQGFGAYAKGLKPEQRQEWDKVKGRVQDIVFSEPVEQLLNLASQRLNGRAHADLSPIYDLAVQSRIVNASLEQSTANALYPLDVVAAYVLTLAIQRYGQNERTLFTFLEATGQESIAEFEPEVNLLYNLADVYDYITYNFHSRLQEINEDSTKWSAIKIAIERAETLSWSNVDIDNAIKLVKVVGLLSIFAPAGAKIDLHFLTVYSYRCMAMSDADLLVTRLEKANILRFAKYKSRYILFEGTDIDIEAGLYEASRSVKMADNLAERVAEYFDFRLTLANAHYFRTGTPRYFQHVITALPIDTVPKGDIDGYVNILVPARGQEEASCYCFDIKGQAILYCLFKDTTPIREHMFEIDKLNWVKDYYVADENDKVANREISKLITYEQSLLRQCVAEQLLSGDVEWIFNGEKLDGIRTQKDLNRCLSMISDIVYSSTPVYHFELINKSRPTGNISLARQNYLQALLDNSTEPNLGFPDNKFPPEKSIFLTLLKNTGMYTDDNGLEAPTEESFLPLWSVCEDFLRSTVSKQRRISELYALLLSPPFRLKQGFLDCWIPTYLIIKKNDYALYSDDRYIPYINKETTDLILRNPAAFSIKAFSVDGIKMEFFEKYREAINLSSAKISTTSFIETIRPFLTFYRQLNFYAKHTKDITSNARKFRDVIANATDPERTFFEILPEQMGFKEITLSQNPEMIESFVNVIHDAIRCLRSCYREFIENIEDSILSVLHIPCRDFSEYHLQIIDRFKSVKTELMPIVMRNFHSRLTGNYNSRTEWIEALCFVPLNKPLSEIRDSEKTFLMTSLKDMFSQLTDYVEMHDSDIDNIVRLHITQNHNEGITKQVIIPEAMNDEVRGIEQGIESLLSGDHSIDVAALINVLRKKLQ